MSDNPRNAPPIKIGLEEDSASFARVEQRTAETFNRLTQLSKATDAVGQSAQQMGRSLSDALALGATKVDDNIRQVQDLRKQVQGLGEDSTKVNKLDLGIGGLRRTGGALSQLGLGEVGGAVSRAGDVAQVVKELGEVGGAVMALEVPLGAVLGVALPVTAAIAGVAIVLSNLQAASEAALKQEQADFEYRKGQLDEEQRIRVEKRTRTKAANDAEIADLQKQIDDTNKLKADLVQQRDKLPGYSPGLATDQQGDPMVRKLNKDIQELTDKATALGHQLGIDVMELDPAIKKREEETKAVKDYSDSLSRSIQMTQLASTGTKKQVDDRIQALQQEAREIRRYIEFFDPALQQTAEGAALYQQLSERLKTVNAELTDLKANVKPIVDAKTAIDEFFKNLKKNADRIAGEVNDRNKRVAEVQQKYETDVAQIEEADLKKRADIQKRYNDAIVQAASQAADAAEQALTKLTQQREDLLTGLNRDMAKEDRDAAVKRLDIQIAAQREEAKAYQSHLQELEQIRKDANAREFGFIMERNFRALIESRVQTTRDMERSNERFTGERATRQQGEQNQIQDLQRSLANQRQERLIAYQQSLQDANTAYRRELTAAHDKEVKALELARQARDASLRELQATTTTELRIRKSAYDQQLKLASLYGAAYVKANDQIMQTLVNHAEQRLAQINGTSGGSTGNTVIGGDVRRLLQRADGGSLNRGDLSLVNDGRPGQRESFNGVMMPRGLGLFMPMQSGYVSNSQTTNNPTINIYESNNPARTKSIVMDALETVMRKR